MGPWGFAVGALLWACAAPAPEGRPARPALEALLAPVEITEWRVPWEGTRPRDPFVDRSQQVWFVGQFGDYVARLDPTTGTFARFDLDPGTGPHNVVVDEQGLVWYTGIRSAHIGRLEPRTGHIQKVPMPDPAAHDPHTLVFDGQGRLWFTVIQGNFVGRLTPATGRVELVPVPTPKAFPYGITLDAAKRPWFTEYGVNQLGTVDPATLTVREVVLPRPETRCRRLAATSDGRIWYVDYAKGFLGRLDPTSGRITEWPVPDGDDARPYGMTVDDRDRLWFVETGPQPNRLVGFDPARETFFSITEIPSGGGAVRNMVYDRATGALWFGTDANTIGRATVP